MQAIYQVKYLELNCEGEVEEMVAKWLISHCFELGGGEVFVQAMADPGSL